MEGNGIPTEAYGLKENGPNENLMLEYWNNGIIKKEYWNGGIME